MVKQNFKRWLKKYLLAEIIGTITAVSAASITHFFSHNLILSAYTGSIGEAIGFYSTIIIQNVLLKKQKNRVNNAFFTVIDFSKIIATIILEFGPAGLIDGLLVRPFFLFLFPIILNDFTLGIFMGKITGDFAFYFLVILSTKIKQRLTQHYTIK